MGRSNLKSTQLLRVTRLLGDASSSALRDLIGCFARTADAEVAAEFLAALGTAKAFLTLNEVELSDVIIRFPAEQRVYGNELLDRLKVAEQQKRSRLESFRDRLVEGDIRRGRQVVFSEQAKCSSCRRIGDQGKQVGPDLTTIGANRSGSDLLESIVFPSASIVRDYGTYQVLTVDGRVLVGLMAGESVDSIQLQPASGELIHLNRDEIEQIIASPVSTMPIGLDAAVSDAGLLDVVTYLQSLKP